MDQWDRFSTNSAIDLNLQVEAAVGNNLAGTPDLFGNRRIHGSAFNAHGSPHDCHEVESLGVGFNAPDLGAEIRKVSRPERGGAFKHNGSWAKRSVANGAGGRLQCSSAPQRCIAPGSRI